MIINGIYQSITYVSLMLMKYSGDLQKLFSNRQDSYGSLDHKDKYNGPNDQVWFT